jgi:adenosine deaminase
MDLGAFIAGLPKAELHMHIEGSLEPELMFELARRNGVGIPYADVEAVRAAYSFSRLQDFLDIYYQGAAVLRTEADFRDLALAYFDRAAADNVRHAEIFFDPQTHTARGIEFAAIVAGITRALAEAQRDLAMSSRLILCFLRDLSAADAMRTLEEALPFKGEIAAVGLDSAECGHPPGKFAEVFTRARREGFKAVAHAGEEGPPAYIHEALDVLQVQRIDHGVRCAEDPQLLVRLARQRIPLTVCPLSNIKLKVFERMAAHNLKRLLDLGLCITINSDDPAYFGGYVLENYLAAQEALNLSRHDLAALARNSFEAAFMPDEAKRRWLRAIDEYVAGAA